jgi:hypothetical protein
MTQTTHIVRMGNGDRSFPLCLAHFANEASTLGSLLDIVQQALQSPFGRSAVEFLTRAQIANMPSTVMLRMVTLLHESDIKGLQRIVIRRIQSDCQLPDTCLDFTAPPLVVFSTPSPICLLYALALANLRYPNMERDFTTWLFAATEGSVVDLNELTEQGRELCDQINSIYANDPEDQLAVTARTFQQFVGRIERLHAGKSLRK